MSRIWFLLPFSLVMSFIVGCNSIPEGVQPIKGFEVDRYLGKWYEIARLDHSFERDLEKVTAEYILKDDGDILVINRGFDTKKQQWSEAKGNAKFVDDPTIGRLRVSFFGPFYGGYNIVALDKSNYQHVMIVGNDRDYLWILSRTPKLDQKVQKRLVAQANSLGFATDKLIYVKQPEFGIKKNYFINHL